jgi:hypothetical protein
VSPISNTEVEYLGEGYYPGPVVVSARSSTPISTNVQLALGSGAYITYYCARWGRRLVIPTTIRDGLGLGAPLCRALQLTPWAGSMRVPTERLLRRVPGLIGAVLIPDGRLGSIQLQLGNGTIEAEAKAVNHDFGTQQVQSGIVVVVCS